MNDPPGGLRMEAESIFGRYRIERLLVDAPRWPLYLASPAVIDRLVTLKAIRPDVAPTPGYRDTRVVERDHARVVQRIRDAVARRQRPRGRSM